MPRINILILAAFSFIACNSADEPSVSSGLAGDTDGWPSDGLYMTVDMDGAQESRLSYDIEPNFFDGGNLKATWEKGDIIKVYEAKEDAGTLTDVYDSYEAYERKFEYPAAPIYDKYYRFECVGGQGTSHGLFKYVGLASATVIGGVSGVDDGFYNVNIDVTYNRKINNWHDFDGVVIFGNPLRNYMMRHQSSNGSLAHLKYGQRMKGHLCNYNFSNWHSTSDDTYGYTDRFILYNTASCIYKIVLDGFEKEVYGGAKLSLSIPGLTSGHVHPSGSDPACYRKAPMTVTLGDSLDHQERRPPWCDDKNSSNTPLAGTKQITAYIIGWPGTCPGDSEIQVQLQDKFYGNVYTWKLRKSVDIVFEEGYYYTFRLTADAYTPVVTYDPSIQTTP